ncbi:MAG: DUF1002 domain-containing protein [Ruminococcaceae bacterium]|nr:DUF1002 domain-containing protein [Oscillospiraceae bacterium]
MKKIISVVLCLAILCSFGSAFAAKAVAGESRAVIGANLTEEQINSVYSIFGINRGDTKELTVTNSEERSYLEGFVESSLIGTNSISCVYIEVLAEGEGLQIATQNISWCTQEMFVNALVTAGIYDAKIIVAAPFPVSGTAAMTGIYKAYEDITGEKIDEAVKLMGTQELVITGELAEEIGNYDATEIVTQLKLILDETKNMSDEQLREQIKSIAQQYNVALTESQYEQLISLCRSFEKMNSDELKEKVEYVQNTAKKLAETQEKITGITQKIKIVVEEVRSFVDKIISIFKPKT